MEIRTNSFLWIIVVIAAGIVAVNGSYSQTKGILLPGVFFLSTLLMVLKGLSAKSLLIGGWLSLFLVILCSIVGFVLDQLLYNGQVTIFGTFFSVISIVAAVGLTWTSVGQKRN